MKKIQTDKAAQAVGPYSQGIDSGDTIYLSGQLGLDAEGEMQDGVVAQAHQSLKNIEILLAEVGLDFTNVVKTLVLLDDMNDFKAVNEVYAQYFKEPYPARSAFAVKGLPLGGLVEIEIIAKRK
ncbi:MAG TPA: Rid family detoxifying hydrolase [Atopostipes sp.]|nr:Rid family detoxifying hydrolase [Atopostipes sp.]